MNKNNDVIYISPEAGRKLLKRMLFSLLTIFLVISLLWYGSNYWTKLRTARQVAENTRKEVAGSLGYESYEKMVETLTAPCLNFWSGVAMQESKFGYVTSEKLIPLRAIASRPNVYLFETYETISPMGVTGVVGTMNVWYPYFVFERRDNGILVGPSLRTPESERRWTPIGLCFCWTTRECLNLERDLPTYDSLEDARLEANGKPYMYRFADHFIKDSSKKDVAT
ncbi:MAG TPA: hypothetical protein PKH07_20830, partial [bacterium]|nr:hypothetical protein [bacterium]